MALFALVGVQIGHTFNCRSRVRSAFDGLFRNPFVWGAVAIIVTLQLLALYQSFLARVLDTVTLNANDWWVIGGTILLPLIVVEVTKLIARHKQT